MRFLSGLNPIARLVVVVVIAATAVGVVGIGGYKVVRTIQASTPNGTTRQFVRGIVSGNSDSAMDYVCPTPSGGFTILPTLKFDWRNDTYTVINQTDDAAEIRMLGESRITKQDWERWSKDLQAQIPQLVSVRAELDFIWQLERDNKGHWCISKGNLIDFVNYFIDLVSRAVEL